MEKRVGSRAEVFHGTALRTSGGLMKDNLVLKDGRISSKRQIAAAEANPALKKWREAVTKAQKKLKKVPEKGEFVPIKGKVATEARKMFKKSYKK